MVRTKKMLCKKCGERLVKDSRSIEYDKKTGDKIIIYNLICPNYIQPHKYFPHYNGILTDGHSAYVSHTEGKKIIFEETDAIFPSQFPHFIKVSEPSFYDKFFRLNSFCLGQL